MKQTRSHYVRGYGHIRESRFPKSNYFVGDLAPWQHSVVGDGIIDTFVNFLTQNADKVQDVAKLAGKAATSEVGQKVIKSAAAAVGDKVGTAIANKISGNKKKPIKGIVPEKDRMAVINALRDELPKIKPPTQSFDENIGRNLYDGFGLKMGSGIRLL